MVTLNRQIKWAVKSAALNLDYMVKNSMRDNYRISVSIYDKLRGRFRRGRMKHKIYKGNAEFTINLESLGNGKVAVLKEIESNNSQKHFVITLNRDIFDKRDFSQSDLGILLIFTLMHELIHIERRLKAIHFLPLIVEEIEARKELAYRLKPESLPIYETYLNLLRRLGINEMNYVNICSALGCLKESTRVCARCGRKFCIEHIDNHNCFRYGDIYQKIVVLYVPS